MIVTTPDQPRPEWEPGARALGATLRGRRMQAGLTLRRCAELMGVTMYELSQFESGQRPLSAAERESLEAAIRSRGGPS